MKIHTLDAGAYAGVVQDSIPPDLLTRRSVKLHGLFTAPASLRIIVSSPMEEAVEIGALLSNASLFLQHPLPREIEYFELDMEYFNPHYFVSPGSRMPQLEDLILEHDDISSNSVPVLDNEKKGRLMSIFDTATDLSILPTKRQSPRIRTRLHEYSYCLSKFSIVY